MRIRHRGGRRRSGAAAVELALILPIFFCVVFGHVEMARMGMVSQLLPLAAREGARVAILSGKTRADVEAAVGAMLTGTGIPPGTVSISPSNWTTAAYPSPISVTLSVPYSQVSWLPSPAYLADKVLSATATLNSERP